MIICSCNALTNHDVEHAVDRGARRPSEIYAARNCKAQCGNCVPGMVCTLRALLQQRANDSGLPPSRRPADVVASFL
ncbi:(2Fe-2S)-binding protein [Brytella acorum]|uniref:Bacterioferritin-associated ferredoxin n=1 Tax=Brytella acorum TaxID=2959299 RepID=A0AA35XVK9_9PROT|nr:(2Fe-2S)-binding protein [Brytella acorum]MDF3623728.1 (2Fe-2S)-binding protein [Brytella acorum]CAI9119854.1 (2Fe-2S)-binding protein [Brytella acorum]